PRGNSFLLMAQQRLWSLIAVVTLGLLLVLSLLFSLFLTTISHHLATTAALPGFGVLWNSVSVLVSFASLTLLFVLLFKLLPDARVAWRDVWVGSLLTALLFTLGQHLIGLYISSSGSASVFGAAGSLVALLVWVYYSAQIVLFGAEFTYAYAC